MQSNGGLPIYLDQSLKVFKFSSSQLWNNPKLSKNTKCEKRNSSLEE